MAIEVGRNVLVPLDVSPSGVKATGSTTTRSLQTRFADVVNVKDFGAVLDGTTDDTVAINAAFAFASASNRDIRLPNGTAIITDTLVHSGSGSITGQGGQATIIRWQDGVSGAGKAILRLAGRTVVLRGIQLQGNSSNAPDTGIDLYPSSALISQMHVFDDVWVGTSTPPQAGLWSHDPANGQQHEMAAFRNSRITGVNEGIRFNKQHEDLWAFDKCYIGHTDAAGASIRALSGSDGIGLRFTHTWLIGPNIGIDLQQGSGFDDLWLEDAGSEGPAIPINLGIGVSARLSVRGQGVAGPITLAANASMILASQHSRWDAHTGGPYNFNLGASAAVFWNSDRDTLTLDSVTSYDPAAFIAEAKTGAGLIVFGVVGVYRRILEQPTLIGGTNTQYFYTPNTTPMLEVQPLYSQTPALRLKKSTGVVQFEVAESVGSTAQAGMILGGVRMFTGTGTPGAGTWAIGDIVWNTAPAAGGAPGWVCTEAGSPGIWKAMANLAP